MCLNNFQVNVLSVRINDFRAAMSISLHVLVLQSKLGPISTRVNKAEQYFNQTGTDCSVSSCPELLKKGKGGCLWR